MEVISKKAAAKLGWDVLLAALADELVSSMGHERLYALEPDSQVRVVRHALACTEEMQQALERRDTIPLEDFLDIRDILGRAMPVGAWVRAEELESVRRVCRASRRARQAFTGKAFSSVSKLTRRLTVLLDLERHIESVVARNGEIRENASRELQRIRRTRRRLDAALREKLRKILQKAVQDGIAAGAQLTVRGGRMVIPLRAEAKRKIQGFVHDTSATGRTVYLEPAVCLNMGNEIRLLEAEEAREIERLLRLVTAHVRTHINVLESNLAILGELDLLHAKARLAYRLGGIVPKISREPHFDIRDGRSPVIALHAGQSKQIVPLNLKLGGDIRTLVITGPNAGGKTVAMKTAGLMSLMLGCGIPVPVHPASSFGVFHHIQVEIGDEQSVEQDLSTFSARVDGLKRMCAEANEGTLVLVDEIGTGTDPAEGAALAQAVLEWFTRHGALTIVTTHHGTLKAYAHQTPGVQNGSLSFDEQTLSPTFVFRQGLPGASYALRIAERMELEATVIERARELIGRVGASLEELMITFESLNNRLEARLAKASTVSKPLTKSKAPVKKQVRRQPGRARFKAVSTLTPGQWVFVDGGTIPCQIIELGRKRAVISFGNMRMHVNVDRLKLADERPPESKKLASVKAPKGRIDLRGYRVRDAVTAVEQFIDQGLSHNIVTLEIVHGKGTGALREAIHACLKKMDQVSSFESPPLNPGVTYVTLA